VKKKITTSAPRRGPGELEGDVLAALWAAPGPVSPAAVQAAVAGELAYNTVHTILTRLCEKRLVTRVPAARGTRYCPTKDAAELVAADARGPGARLGPWRCLAAIRHLTRCCG